MGMNVALAVGVTMYVAIFLFSLYLIVKPEKINVLVVPAVRNRFTLRFFKPETLEIVLERIDHELRAFREALQEFISNRKPVLAAVLILSYAAWVATALVPAVVLTGLGLKTPYFHAMGVTIVFYLAAAYAPTPGSSGAAELGFAALFSTIVPRAVLGLFVTVWRVITYYLNLALGGALMALCHAPRIRTSQSLHRGRQPRRDVVTTKPSSHGRRVPQQPHDVQTDTFPSKLAYEVWRTSEHELEWGAHGLTCNKTTLALLRVIGGWILAVGSFIVAIAVTAEFFADPDPALPNILAVT